MKAIVTGARGMLGTEVCRELRSKGQEVIATDIGNLDDQTLRLDICDWRQVQKFVDEHRPDIIYHLAAETNVDLCEEKPDHAFRVNSFGVENMALASQQRGIPIVYISTAGVFDGVKKDPYTEFDQPNPINVYGHSKLRGEEIVSRVCSQYFIFRAGWMIGGWVIDKKFVYKIVQQILEGKKEIRAVNDKFGSPTFTVYFAKNAIEVVETGRHGLYHLCGGGSCSRYDLACEIVRILGKEKEAKVVAVSSDDFPLPAPRPRSEIMRNNKLDLLGINKMPHWKSALQEYLSSNVALQKSTSLA